MSKNNVFIMKQFMNKLLVVFFLIIGGGAISFAQIGINTETPNEHAALDIRGLQQGVLLPGMSATQLNAMVTANPGLPANLTVFNTTNRQLSYFHSGRNQFEPVSNWRFTSNFGNTNDGIYYADHVGIGGLSSTLNALTVNGDINVASLNNGYKIGNVTVVAYRNNQTIMLGNDAGVGSTGEINVYVGCLAGNNAQGRANVLLGHWAGGENLDGDDNIMLGGNAGQNCVGDQNIGLGVHSAENIQGSYNVALGNGSAFDCQGDNNVFLGSRAGASCETSGNIAIGLAAGENMIGSGGAVSYNMFFGLRSGINASGDNNIFMGANSGENNTGSLNTGLGIHVLENCTGESNIAIGNSAGVGCGSDYNVLVGILTGSELGNGDDRNTFVGGNAGELAQGSLNTYIGRSAGYDTDGDHNVILGANSNPNAAYNNIVAIGYGAGGWITGDNQFVLHSSESGPGPLISGDFSDLTVNIPGTLTVGGCVNCGSDRRLKNEIRPIDSALDKIGTLKGYHFNWNSDARENSLLAGPQIGLIAQEVEEVFPELVGEDSRGMKFVRYQKMVGPIVQAINELDDEKDAEIATLKSEVETLESRITALERAARQ